MTLGQSFHVQNRMGVGISATEPFPLNVGGAGGPKIVTTTFATDIGRGYGDTARLSADLPRADFQDAFAIRRRAARAVVGLGRRTSVAIGTGTLAYSLERKIRYDGQALPWFQLGFQNVETFEGFERFAVASIDLHAGPDDGQPEVNPDTVRFIASRFKALADGLHSAVDLPGNLAFFGSQGSTR